jgi:hypothetical protein
MAAPSLGQAIGLNVQRKDIFGPAAKQLGANLAEYYGEKEKKKKEGEEKASKWMTEIIKYSPSDQNRKVRPESMKYYDGQVLKLEKALENPDVSSTELIKIISETNNGMASFRDQSKSFNDVESAIRANPDSVPISLRNFIANPNLMPDKDDVDLWPAFGIVYDPETNTIASTGFKPVDVRAEIVKNAPTEEMMKASLEQANANPTIIKTKTGYDPIAFIKLQPDQQQYLLGLVNVIDSQPGALNSITEEIVRSKYNGDYKRYKEDVANIIKSDYDQSMTSIQNAEAFSPTNKVPYAQAESPRPMTPSEAAKRMATDFMLETHFPQYQQAGTKTLDINKTSTPKGGSGSGQTTTSPSATTVEGHLSSEGKARALEEGMDEQIALDISLNRRAASAEEKKKANRITQGAILGDGPTISLQTQGNEVVTIGTQSVNPRKLWYDRKKGQFHLIFDKQVSGEGTSQNIFLEDMVLTREQVKQLNASPNTSVKAQLEQWNLNSKSNNVPTIDSYIVGGSSASKSSSAPSGGKKKKVF